MRVGICLAGFEVRDFFVCGHAWMPVRWERLDWERHFLSRDMGVRVADSRSCVRKYMKSTSESLSHPETSNGRAAGGNCVVVRRGGEQPEADLRSQTKVNPIRFATTASLRPIGEVCRMGGNRFLPHPSFTGEKRVVVDGWGENAGKVSCGRVEICLGRNPRERSRAEVRASIVAMKRGNARGVRGGRKVERQKP